MRDALSCTHGVVKSHTQRERLSSQAARLAKVSIRSVRGCRHGRSLVNYVRLSSPKIADPPITVPAFVGGVTRLFLPPTVTFYFQLYGTLRKTEGCFASNRQN